MPEETIVILGIPIDNLTMDEAISRILIMIDTFAHDRRPRLVATVNVDFLVNTLSWFNLQPRHPELLGILRRADLVTADGMPLVWAARMVGTPLKERVTGADLVPALAREAAGKAKAIFFLGGKGDVGRKAAEVLKNRFPELIIAGVDAPFVSIAGDDLADEKERDARMVETINRSGADILLVAFGNPKQEMWFERNRANLQVPVTIGIGGTFEFITGSVARAPRWMQKSGLEWIYRITQDPKRLWKRYAIGLFKFSLMILPTLLYHNYTKLVFRRRGLDRGMRPSPRIENSGPGAMGAMAGQIIILPNPLDALAAESLRHARNAKPVLGGNTVLDLSHVSFIDSAGIGLLVSIWRSARDEGKALYLAGMSPAVRRIMKVSRTLDLFGDQLCDTTEEAARMIHENRSQPFFHYLFSQNASHLLLRLYGQLDAARVADMAPGVILDLLEDRHCIIDLSGLSFLDSAGLMALLKIRRHATSRGRDCWLCGATGNVRQMMHITRLDQLMQTAADVDEAIARLTPQ